MNVEKTIKRPTMPEEFNTYNGEVYTSESADFIIDTMITKNIFKLRTKIINHGIDLYNESHKKRPIKKVCSFVFALFSHIVDNRR